MIKCCKKIELRVNEMNAEKINNYYAELEKIATYNNESITDEEFSKNLLEIKMDSKKEGFDMPEIFDLVKTKSDFRKNMQKYGGYQERREKLREGLYPIIDIYEQKILNSKTSIISNKLSIREINDYLKINNLYLKTKYGKILIYNLESKSGGNGTVYFGKMADVDVAIKFLINNSKEKLNRFLCEYGNVILKLSEKDGIVKMYFYDEIVINNNIYPLICMKRYISKLVYDENYSEDEIIDFVKQILYATSNIHKQGIFHRDLKPDNILIDEEGRLFIADFGIAYYNPEIFEKTGHTTEGERLANFDFSAHEQRNSETIPNATMDIYAIGQITQWLVFGKTTKGTHRKRLYEKFNTPRMHFLDDIVDKCLNDDPQERFQSVEEIFNEIEKYNSDKKQVQERNTQIKVDKHNKDIDINELKNALQDIMDKICLFRYGEYNENVEPTFTLSNPMSDKVVKKFLESIPQNLKKLEFFDTVTASKFIENFQVYDKYEIDKKYYELLSEKFEAVQKNSPELETSFIEYVKTKINFNVEELPF